MADPLVDEVLDAEDIQGNSLAGFRKDCQRFLFFSMDRSTAGLAAMRAWLRRTAGEVSSLAEVHAFNQLFKLMRTRRGRDPRGLTATWFNIAFSAGALRVLTSDADVEQFTDDAFKAGLAASALLLNDPVDGQGRPIDWQVGAPDNEADVVILVASDDPRQLADRIARLEKSLHTVAAEHGVAPLTLIFDQFGTVLPAPLRGHEHFGFKDGVSQPGVRGFVRQTPPELLTPRLFDASVKQDDVRRPEFSKPGQPLVWPGQFVFGYNRQDTQDPRKPMPVDASLPTAPAWGRNGSYVVIRRLRQDVKAFRDFIAREAARLAATTAFAGMTPTRLASLLVGRWPSGAPLMRSAERDNERLAADEHANNFFEYVEDSPPAMRLTPELGHPDDTFPLSEADTQGRRCPLSAHVRKVNPRDTVTEQGNNADALTRLVLRRGVPFGDEYDGADPATRDSPESERGLIFVSYQTSIDRQFVFLQKNWINDPIDPNGGGGQDGIIGQRSEPGRLRSVTIVANDGTAEALSLDREWVIPTGGGFFFSPSISAIRDVLGRA